MEEDTRLVERYRSGYNDAIEELVMKYQKQIYAFVYRIINDPEEAKDLTQKTFLKAFHAIGGFRKEASFKTWLYKIAMNKNRVFIETFILTLLIILIGFISVLLMYKLKMV